MEVNGFVQKRDCEYSIRNRACLPSQKKACWASIKKSNYIFEADMGDETPFNEWKMPRGSDTVHFIQSTAKQYIMGMANELGGCIYFGLEERKDDSKNRFDRKHVQGVTVSTEDQSNIENSIRNYYQNEVKGLGYQTCPKFPTARCPFHLVWFQVVDGTSKRHISDRWILEIHVFSIKDSLQTVFFLETSVKGGGMHLVTYSYSRQEMENITNRSACLNYLRNSIDVIISSATKNSTNVNALKAHWKELNDGHPKSQNTSDTAKSLDMLLSKIPSSVDKTLKGVFSEDHNHSRPPLVLIAGCLFNEPDKENFKAIREMLCQIPWSLVMDTDPFSKLYGLMSTAINLGTPHGFNWYRYGTNLPSSVHVTDPTCWVSVFGVENDQDYNFPVIKDLASFSNQRNPIRDFIETFKSAFKAFEEKPKVCVIRLFPDIDQLFSKLTDSVIRDLRSNDNVVFSANEPASDELKAFYGGSFISLPMAASTHSAAWQLELLLKYYVSDALRGQRKDVFVSGAKDNPKICIPPTYVTALKASKVTIIQHVSLNSERYKLSSDEQLRHQTDFYMGKAVTFESLHYKHEIDRDSILCRAFSIKDFTATTDEICKVVGDGIDHRVTTGTYWIRIFHESGAGGTTLARKLMYDLAKQYPCIMFDDWTSDSDDEFLSRAVNNVIEFRSFLKSAGQEVLCLLVEDSMQTAKSMVDKLTQIRSTASFVLITTERKAESDWPKEKDGALKKKDGASFSAADSCSHLHLFLGARLSANEKSTVKAILMRLANDDMKEELSKLPEDENARIPFWLYGLYCFAGEYTRIKQVVSDCLKSARTSPFESNVLKFTSLIKVYASLSTPWSLFKLFNRTRLQNATFIYSETISFQTRQLLLEYPSNNSVSVAHPKLAEEILNQLCAINNDPKCLLELVKEFFHHVFASQTKYLFETEGELGKLINISGALLGIVNRREEKNDFGKLLNEIETYNVADSSKSRTIILLDEIREYVDTFDSNRSILDDLLKFKRGLVIHEAFYVEQRTKDFTKSKSLLDDFLKSLTDSASSAKAVLHNAFGNILRREVKFNEKVFDLGLKDSKRKPQKEELEKFLKTITELWLKSVYNHREAFQIDSSDLYGLTGEALVHQQYMIVVKKYQFRNAKTNEDHQGFLQWLRNVPKFPNVNSREPADIFSKTLQLWANCAQRQSKSDDQQQCLESMINKYEPLVYKLVGDIDRAIELLEDRLHIQECVFAYVRCYLSKEKLKQTISDEKTCRELVHLVWPIVSNGDNKFKGESIRTILRIMPHITISHDERDKILLEIASDDAKIRELLLEWLDKAPEFEYGDANFFVAVDDFTTPIGKTQSHSTPTKDPWVESGNFASNHRDKDMSILYLGQKSGAAQRFIFHKDIDIPNKPGNDIHFFDHKAEHRLLRLKGWVDQIKDHKTGHLSWKGERIFFRPYYSIRTLMASGTEVWFFLSFSKCQPKAQGVVPVCICDNSGRLDPDKMEMHLKEKRLLPWDRAKHYYPVLDSSRCPQCREETCDLDDGNSESPRMHEALSSPDQPQYPNCKDDSKPLDQRDILKEHLMQCNATITEFASFLATTTSQSLLNDKLDEKNGAALHFLIDKHIPNIDEAILLPVVELLLQNGASVYKKDKDGQTPYQLLCQKCPANKYAKTKEKLKPLNPAKSKPGKKFK